LQQENEEYRRKEKYMQHMDHSKMPYSAPMSDHGMDPVGPQYGFMEKANQLKKGHHTTS
jgi:predicted AlkP superfamily pyrophosphatase or phosphodiesterase